MVQIALSLWLMAFVVAPCVEIRAQGDHRFIEQTTSLPYPRAFHGTAVLKDYLYVFGGSLWDVTNNMQHPAGAVNVARIADNGHLSRWVQTTPIDVPRNYVGNSTIVLNDTVYIIGGSTAIEGGERVKTVAWTRPLNNGMLEPWRVSQPFDETGLSCVAAFSTPGYLHVTGGNADTHISNKVWSVPIKADGSLGEWFESPPLPAPLWFHHAAVFGGKAYVWGGLNEESSPVIASKKIYSAPILASGELGRWSEEPQELPAGFYSASSAACGPYIFSLSPRYDRGLQSNDILWTQITPQGMGKWNRRETQIPIRVYHAAAVDYRRGYIYLPGGKPTRDENETNLAFMVKLAPSAVEAGRQAWLQNQVAHNAKAWESMQGAQDITASSFSNWAGSSAPARSTAFTSLANAQQEHKAMGKAIVMYFAMDGTKPCQQQEQLLQSFDFQSHKDRVVFAKVDIREDPQVAQFRGVFRVPTWIMYNGTGEETHRLIGAQAPADLETVVSRLF
ncbi:MAG: hypothetical protein RLY93_02120 [Sumerlaeia bacterium]